MINGISCTGRYTVWSVVSIFGGVIMAHWEIGNIISIPWVAVSAMWNIYSQ